MGLCFECVRAAEVTPPMTDQEAARAIRGYLGKPCDRCGEIIREPSQCCIDKGRLCTGHAYCAMPKMPYKPGDFRYASIEFPGVPRVEWLTTLEAHDSTCDLCQMSTSVARALVVHDEAANIPVKIKPLPKRLDKYIQPRPGFAERLHKSKGKCLFEKGSRKCYVCGKPRKKRRRSRK